jgi:hypothetical protein
LRQCNFPIVSAAAGFRQTRLPSLPPAPATLQEAKNSCVTGNTGGSSGV